VQRSPFTGKEDPNLHLQAFIQLCPTFKWGWGSSHSRYSGMLCNGSTLNRRRHSKIGMCWWGPSWRNTTRRVKLKACIIRLLLLLNILRRLSRRHSSASMSTLRRFHITSSRRTIIDALVGGSIIELTPTESFTLFKKVADNDTSASSGRLLPVQPMGNIKGVLQVEKKTYSKARSIHLCGGWRRWR
jgi:hypothetical protein